MFRLYFDEDVNNPVKTESERYAIQKLNHKFYLPQSDLDTFVSTVLLSRYHTLPQEHLYWCNDEDVGVNLMKKKILQNRFQEIKQYFHLADNDNLQQGDKLAMIRSYLNIMQRNFFRFGVFSEHLSIDEQIAPCYGHFSTKLYMRNKPVKFGMKIWFFASAQGYPFSFDVYTYISKDMSSSKPLRERVVNKLIAVIKNYSNNAIFFDNFFSSTALCRDLARKSLRCTGTIYQNRTQNYPLTLQAVMKKNQCGVFEPYSDGEVVLCQWNDNNQSAL